jgi:hypothetical protein
VSAIKALGDYSSETVSAAGTTVRLRGPLQVLAIIRRNLLFDVSAYYRIIAVYLTTYNFEKQHVECNNLPPFTF